MLVLAELEISEFTGLPIRIRDVQFSREEVGSDRINAAGRIHDRLHA